MKMKSATFVMMILAITLFFGCHPGNDSQNEIITKRIQYDVDIKSPDPDFYWWRENIEGADREKFVRWILESAYDGSIKVYDYFNNPMTPEQVKMIGHTVDTFKFQRAVPPYDLYDTIVEEKFNIQDITRIRFLEEWYFDKHGLGMEKRIIGISPMLRNYDEQGSFRGYMPMFWIYFDTKYPAEMESPGK